MHLHDLCMFSGYCAGWSLKQLLEEGLGGVPNKISSHPPHHLSTLIAQMVNFLGVLQNEWAGAQAFSSFDTYLAPFIRHDGIGYRDGEPVITLHMEAYLGAPESYDAVRIEGSPPLYSKVEGGLHGDITTASVTVNTLARALTAPAGLQTMRDLPIPSWWSGM